MSKLKKIPQIVLRGRFHLERFVPGDHVKIEFDCKDYLELEFRYFDFHELFGEEPTEKGEL